MCFSENEDDHSPNGRQLDDDHWQAPKEPPTSSSPPAINSSSPASRLWESANRTSGASTIASSASMNYEPRSPGSSIGNKTNYFSAMLYERLLFVQQQRSLSRIEPVTSSRPQKTSDSDSSPAAKAKDCCDNVSTTHTLNETQVSSLPPSPDLLPSFIPDLDDGEEADTEDGGSLSTPIFASPSPTTPDAHPAQNVDTDPNSPQTTRLIHEPDSYVSLQERNAAARRLHVLQTRRKDLQARKSSILRRMSIRKHQHQSPVLQRQHRPSSESDVEPPFKRSRTGSKRSSRSMTSSRTHFAKQSASSRRAASLKLTEQQDTQSTLSADGPPTSNSFESSASVDDPQPNSTNSGAFVLPIIAPPAYHVARLPLSGEASAKLRLMRIREREDKLRRKEVSLFLETMFNIHQTPNANRKDDRILWESRLGIGEALRSEVVEWILEVLPIYPDMETPSTTSSSSPSESPRPSFEPAPDHQSSTLPPSPDISDAYYDSSSNSSSSDTLASSRASSPIKKDPWKYSNLHDQLSTSPNTRFHAAHLLLRYCFLIIGNNGNIRAYESSDSESDSSSMSETDSYSVRSREADLDEGRQMVVWDTAVACLALSVKFHRDFLAPLLPVLASEFQALSPQPLSYEDLETSQRDILCAVNYSLGISPQPIIEDLWAATPALRELFPQEVDKNCLLKETWTLLYGAIEESDVLRYPIWLLTTAALAGGTIAALKTRFEHEMNWYEDLNIRRRRRNAGTYVVDARMRLREKLDRKARKVAEGAILDLQVNVGVSQMKFMECLAWLQDTGR